ncbi:MAG: DUF3169 family protein [Bacillota bacterium]|nr:DUF3169 family protein [Bacillota bacterium]
MKKTKNNKLRNIIILILIGVLGLLSGLYGARMEFGKNLYAFIQGLENWLFENSYALFLIGTVGLSLLTWALYVIGKGQVQKQLKEDAEIIDDNLLGLALAINSTIIVLGVVFFINHFRYILANDIGLGPVVGVLLVYFGTMIISLAFPKLSLEFMKTYNPEIYDDVYDLDFQKKYVDSVDEREKLEIYKAGYRAFKAMLSLVLFFLFLAVIILLNTNGSILYTIVLAIIIIVGIVAYTLEAMKK